MPNTPEEYLPIPPEDQEPDVRSENSSSNLADLINKLNNAQEVKIEETAKTDNTSSVIDEKGDLIDTSKK